jgi:thiol-disulfide isomerase/thioredoxin/outer membrane lipoprotein-sorting protein
MNKRIQNRRLRSVIAIGVGLALGWWAAGCMQGTNVLARGAQTIPATKPTVSPEVRQWFDDVQKNHKRFELTRIKSTEVTTVRAQGRENIQEVQTTTWIAKDGRVRLEAVGMITIVFDGTTLTIFDENSRRYSRRTLEQEATLADRVRALLVTLDPLASVLISGSMMVDTMPPSGVATTRVVGNQRLMERVVNDLITTLAYEPTTLQIQSVTTEFSKSMSNQGIAGVEAANTVRTYQAVEDATGMKSPFEFVVPADAVDAAEVADGEMLGVESPLVGKELPDMTLSTLDGKQQKLSDLKGSIVVLDFWATWCGPCRESLPHMDELVQEYGEKGVKGFAVNIQEEPTTIRPFIENAKIKMPVLLDSDGRLWAKIGVGGIPTVAIIGRDGVVQAVLMGPSKEQVKLAIEDALK